LLSPAGLPSGRAAGIDGGSCVTAAEADDEEDGEDDDDAPPEAPSPNIAPNGFAATPLDCGAALLDAGES
jgi:hypothetical protein